MQNLTKLRPSHRSLARLLLTGHTIKEASQILGLSYTSATRIANTPLFESEMVRLNDQADARALDVGDDLQVMARKALEVLDSDLHLEPENEQLRRIRQSAAKDVLDRTRETAKKGNDKGGSGSLEVNVTNIDVKSISGMQTNELRDAVFDLLGSWS